MAAKVYNIKESDLGKVTFPDGTCFIRVTMDSKWGQLSEMLVMKDIDECVKYYSTWAMKKAQETLDNPLEFHGQIINWLIENWMEAIKDLKQDMYLKYGFDEFRDQDPVEWIKSEPEMVSLTLIHIAGRFTNGYVKCPVGNMEISVKFIKNLITVNFWEEGNPRSPEPLHNRK